MPDPFFEIMKSLAASGPVALVLGYWSWTLWRANQVEHARHEAVEQRQRDECDARTRAVADRYATLLESENSRHQKEEDELRRDYVDTLKSFTGVFKGDPHAG